MRAIFSLLAEADLEEIGDYIALDNPRRAVSFIVELRTRCVEIAAAPLSCRARPELGPGLRSCVHGSYVIFLTVKRDHVMIVRVLHGARDLPRIFSESS